MSLVNAWTLPLALLLVGPPGQPGNPAAAGAPAAGAPAPGRAGGEVSGNKEERVRKAYEAYEKQRFDDSALEFEGLWKEYKEPQFLFNAAASRAPAGHHAHAVAYLSDYLAASGLSAEDRKEAEAMRAASLRDTVAVRVELQVEGQASSSVGFTAQHVPKLASDIRPPLPFTPTQVAGAVRTRVVQLDPGEWKIRVEAEGFVPAEQVVQVVQGAQPVVRLALVRAPVADTPGPVAPTELPDDVRGKFVKGGSIAGGLVLLGGVGALTPGALRFSSGFKADAAGCMTQEGLTGCRETLAQAGMLRAAGAGLLGAGAGGLVGGLTGLIRDPDKRRKAWIAEAAIGGAAVVGGAVWVVLSARSFTEQNSQGADTMTSTWGDETDRGGAKKFATQHTAAAAVLGLGSGLVVSAVAGLLLERAYGGGKRRTAAMRSLKLAGGASPTWSGLVLSGRF